MSEQELEKVLTAVEDESDVLGSLQILATAFNLLKELLTFFVLFVFISVNCSSSTSEKRTSSRCAIGRRLGRCHSHSTK
jgi:hypothetical protein